MRGAGASPPTDTGARGRGPGSASGYWVAVERRRWRPADEQGRSRLTRMAVDRGAQLQTVRVISAPLILDGPRHPGVERSSRAHRAVMDMIEGRCASSVKVLTPEVHPYRYPRRSEVLSEVRRRRCATAIGNVNKAFVHPLSATPWILHRPHAGRSGLTATVGPWRPMTSEGFSCHGTYNTDGQPAWASGLREHVTEGVHIATASGVEDPDLPAPQQSRHLSSP